MNYFKTFESYNDQNVIQVLRSRIPLRKYKAYLKENDTEDDEYWFEEFLYDTYYIRVNEEYNAIEINELDSTVKKLIGDLPVVLYHFTSTNLIDSIKDNGLIGGYHKTNPHQNSYRGVYLTTETSGNAVGGYKNIAIQQHGGDVAMVTVKMFLNEIKSDPDDRGLLSGKFQFISNNIPPERIMNIEEVY